MAVLLGILVAMGFGAADFVGGRASMRANASAVLFVAQCCSIVGALVVALLVSAEVGTDDLVYGAFAGLATVLGLGLLYRGLASGAMGVVAPVTAVVGALVPVTWGVTHGERPSAVTWLGIGLAIVAGGIIAIEPGTNINRLAPGVVTAICAGAALGSSLVLFSETSEDSGMWPVFAARLAAVIAAGIAVSVLMRRDTYRFPHGSDVGAAITAGALDVTATALILVAVRRGLVSVVAGLAALAPGFTVVLAWVFLREHLRVEQRVGLVVALAGLVLVAVG
jgi:uncharacterized membrane protein